jgi:ribose 1,5-bisphosphokinase
MGKLVLVVGPSGAGKDTLMRKARKLLANDQRFVFARRVITRPADAETEDHDSMTPEAFAEAEAGGAFALSWEAHGLKYGIPISIEEDLRAGRTVIANGSRRMLIEALTNYPDAMVAVVDAPLEVRAARLAERGREDVATIAERLGREGGPVPAGAVVVPIDNSGEIDLALVAFLSALLATV